MNWGLRKALFQRGLERNGKYKNVPEFVVEKIVRIFLQNYFCLINYAFKIGVKIGTCQQTLGSDELYLLFLLFEILLLTHKY